MTPPGTDPWRLRCPEGHSALRRRRDPLHDPTERGPRFYCDSCRAAGADPVHDHAIDAKTGRQVSA